MVNPGNVFMALGKDIPLLFQECHECLTKWWAGKGANLGHSLTSGVIEEYLFKLFNGLCKHSLFFYAHGL